MCVVSCMLYGPTSTPVKILYFLTPLHLIYGYKLLITLLVEILSYKLMILKKKCNKL